MSWVLGELDLREGGGGGGRVWARVVIVVARL